MTNKYLLKIILITQLTLLFGYVNLGYASDNNLQKIDYIKIVKSERKLYTYSDQRLIKTYKIALGRNPIGHKKIAGDNKTPEGLYQITTKNPNSQYHLSLKISYPSKTDIQNEENSSINLGDNITIHGIRNG